MNTAVQLHALIETEVLPIASPQPALWLRLTRKIRRSAYRFRDGLHLFYERTRMSFSGMRPLRILISNGPETTREVTAAIQAGFARSLHTVEIGPITRESFRQFDLVVPITISESLQVHQWPSLLKRNPLPVPSAESIQLCHDKQALNQRLIENGFGSYIPKVAADRDPPYILKKRTGIAGMECWIIRTNEDEKLHEVQLNDPLFYSQEVIRGPREFATHILFANGKIVRSLNIMYEFQTDMPIKGKDWCSYRVIHRCPYLDLFTTILASIGFEGLCCVNYKVVRGRPYLLEINPRLGSSLGPYFFSFLRCLKFPPAALEPEVQEEGLQSMPVSAGEMPVPPDPHPQPSSAECRFTSHTSV